MVLIFPLVGIILAAARLLLNNPYSIGILPGMVIYSLEYTIIAAICFVAFLVMLSLFVDLEKPNEKYNGFYGKVIAFTLKVALSACNVKVKVEGEEKIPDGRFVLIQNHKAMFDPMVSLAFLEKHHIGFITKPENMHLPVINKFMHKICCIPIDRENARNAVKAIDAAANNVKNDLCSMAIYPEGTRARDGKMLPFHAGSFKIATKSGAPLVISTVDNTNHVHNNAPFKRTVITLKICDVISAEEVKASSTAVLSEKARKIMLESLGITEE